MKLLLTLSTILLLAAGSVFADQWTEKATDGTLDQTWAFNSTTGDAKIEVVDSTASAWGSYVISFRDSGYTGLTYLDGVLLTDYAIEADIYIIGPADASANLYTGIGIKMASDATKYYRLVYRNSSSSDNGQIKLQGYDGSNWHISQKWNPGVDIDTLQTGWHNFKIKVRGADFWAYIDGQMLPGCPFTDDDPFLTEGYPGIYKYNGGAGGVLFDNFVVTTPDIFFSEYEEGSSNNKALEIFNPTDQVVDLTQYAFPSTTNDPTTPGEYEYWNTFAEDATLAPGDVYVITHPDADSEMLAHADQTFQYLSNGDDGFALVKGTESDFYVIDRIGTWDADPGSGWDVAGVAAATKDHTLLRKSSVFMGEANWASSAGTDSASSDWLVMAKNDHSNLGMHTMDGFVAPPADVTFQVNMSVKVRKGEFDPMTQVVRMTGNITDPQWDPANAPILEMVDSVNYIFATTLTVDPGDYEYKYLIGDAWGADELQGKPNRSISVTSTETLDPVYFNNEDHVTFPSPPAGMVNVMLSVNMSRQNQIGKFDPAADTVRVTGSITDPQWDPANAPILEDGDANLVYTTTIQVAPGDYEYKYLLGSAWGNDELQGQPNRSISVTGDTALIPVYFNNEEYVVNPPEDTVKVNLTLSVDMAVQILEGDFDPSTDVVRCAGAFQGWSPSTAPDMVNADLNVDSIYTVTYQVSRRASYEYKFLIGTDWGNDEANNRSVVVGDDDVVVPTVFFDDDEVVTIKADGNIKFNVNMDVLTEVGIFNPAADSVHVRGNFNGWNSDDPSNSHMERNASNPLNWFLNVPFTQVGIGDNQYYKYYVQLANTTVNGVEWADGWERPTTTGGGNRAVAFAGQTAQDLDPVYYDDVHPDWVVPTGTNLQVTFNVDMTPATDPLLQAIPFTAGDTLYWICEEPAFVVTQGWEDTNEMRVLQLTDDDGDMIYSGTLTVQEPAWNSFVYRYAYVHAADGSWNAEPEGFSNFAYRVRFVGQDAARSFPKNPWNMPLDTWTNTEVKSDQETDPFTSYTAIDDEIAVPKTYALLQNYPNPFNPTTTIPFTLAKSGKVTLSIYNVLGQKVRTLLNNEIASAGTHVVKWDGLDNTGSRAASGVYFYKIQSGKFSAVQKMILMK